MQAYWKDVFASTVKYRPQYGTCPNAATFDEAGDQKRLDILQNPDHHIQLFDKLGHLIETKEIMKLFVYIINNILCGHFMLRGSKEPIHLTRADFSFILMPKGYYEGCPSLHLRACHTGQKKKSMTVSNHTRQDVSETTNYQPLVRLSNSVFDPYNLVELYFFNLLPREEIRKTRNNEPIRLLQQPAAIAQREKWRKAGYPYVYAAGNNPWGKNMPNEASKRHALTFGFDNPERNTGHGARKKGYTSIGNAAGIGIKTKLAAVRHQNEGIGVRYDHGTRESQDRCIAALQGTAIPMQHFADNRPSLKPAAKVQPNTYRQLEQQDDPSPPTEHRRPPLDSSYTGLADRSAPPPPHLHHHEEPLPLTRLTRQRSRSLSQSPSKRVRHGRTAGMYSYLLL